MSIKHIDIINFSHFDLGYTDHQTVARELHKRYIDLALDDINLTMKGEKEDKFYWTAEAMLSVYDWWEDASECRRKELIRAIESGQFEVTGFAFNNTPFMNKDQWDIMLNWIPEELWFKFNPKLCMQNDVNGIPVAGVMRAVKKGIRYLWIGPNSHNGGAPFKQPSAFKWKLPDGNHIFVWLDGGYLGDGYCNANYLFNENWWLGPVPAAADLRFRAPEKGDMFSPVENKVLEAHRHCLENIKKIEMQSGEGNGYKQERLLISMTNQWRIDNDPPFLGIVEFVKTWNRMGLEPFLRLTTSTVAMIDLEKEMEDKIPVYCGEWTDWWANGSISAPVEISASRKAKRIIKAIKSSVFGNMDDKELDKVNGALKDLCLFDEHVWGSFESIANPYSQATRGQISEKYSYVYRSLAATELILSDRVRNKFKGVENGIYITNTSDLSNSCWVELPSDSLRDEYTCVKNGCTGEINRIYYEPGVQELKRPEKPEQISIENASGDFADKVPGKKARFWSGVLKPWCTVYYSLLKGNFNTYKGQANTVADNKNMKPMIIKDDIGWPEYAIWDGMNLPLFNKGFGEFMSYKPVGFAPRWAMKDIFITKDNMLRTQMREKYMREETALYDKVDLYNETPFTYSFQQTFFHPSLVWGIRQLELWKEEPRAQLIVKINRRPSADPETFYIKFTLPCEGIIPYISNGGYIFKPGGGQLPGTCMDYFAIDGWAHYASEGGNWIWSGADTAMITFEKPQVAARINHLPEKTEVILSMVFDNTWDTNFVADSHGIMEFKYNLLWKKNIEKGIEVNNIAESLSTEPVIFVKVRYEESDHQYHGY